MKLEFKLDFESELVWIEREFEDVSKDWEL